MKPHSSEREASRLEDYGDPTMGEALIVWRPILADHAHPCPQGQVFNVTVQGLPVREPGLCDNANHSVEVREAINQ